MCELNENSCLLETYIPEFAADRTDVKMTAFIITAATSKPIFWNTIVKGDAVTLLVSSNLGSFAETIEDIINIVAI